MTQLLAVQLYSPVDYVTAEMIDHKRVLEDPSHCQAYQAQLLKT